ncbi:MAG: hypothetical protein B7Y21_04670 [Hydrogenophilales bacterium 16-61-112]|nr:MAG: hypothetical protein B7Y21_04670 [Hydrogenophilales bacterium 16-61-112]
MRNMMVSSTHCCRKPDAAWRKLAGFWLASYLLAGWLLVASSALAADKSAVRKAAIRATPQGYVLDADVELVLNPTLEDALSKGINLYFLLELDVSRPGNWWWFDENIATQVRKMRIYYHLLLRRYVVENGYVTLLGRVSDWQVIERGGLKTGRRYDARLRLRLDTERLPKPLSIGGVPGARWELDTPWYKWSFDAPAVAVAPAAPVVLPLP